MVRLLNSALLCTLYDPSPRIGNKSTVKEFFKEISSPVTPAQHTLLPVHSISCQKLHQAIPNNHQCTPWSLLSWSNSKFQCPQCLWWFLCFLGGFNSVSRVKLVLNPNFQNTSHLTSSLIRLATLASTFAHIPVSAAARGYGPFLAPWILDPVSVLFPAFMWASDHTPVPTSASVPVSISVTGISPVSMD